MVPDARHTACTIEMLDMRQRVDVAVIDEIQLIGDDQRGAAWTRALLGVPANEVHVCGDESALPLVQQVRRTPAVRGLEGPRCLQRRAVQQGS